MNNRRHIGNRGLSLVELLVAIAILGIVVAPLLHSFVTAAQTAHKSRAYGDATTAAQNILETIEAADVNALLRSTDALDSLGSASYYDNSGGALSASSEAVKDGGGCYYIGLRNVTSGDSSFDALVTLNADSAVNAQRVSQYTELVAVSQPAGADNPDTLARDAFGSDCAAYAAAGSVVTERTLAREIIITVKAGSTEGPLTRYPVDITYSYTGGFRADTEYVPFEYVADSSTSYSVDTSAAEPDTPLFSMYFFFSTFYGSSVDSITVYNNQNTARGRDLCFNLFLVRQRTGETDALDAGYRAAITQYELSGGGTDEAGDYLGACKIYTNLSTNLNTGAELSGFQYQVKLGGAASPWFNPGTEEPKLVVARTGDRFFYISLQLFAAGEGFGGTPLLSMDTAKLN